MDRLRNRDLRTNNNKCYTMYFDDDQNKDITNKTSTPAKKGKNRSPRKKEPIKNCNANQQLTSTTTAANETELKSSNDTLSSVTMVRDIKNNDAVAVTDNGTATTTITTTVTTTINTATSRAIEINAELNADNALDFSATNEHKVETSKLSKCNGNDNANGDKNVASPSPIANENSERNERKRRLSQSCSDRNEDIDPDDDDDDVASNETESLIYNGKKAKIEFSKMKMYQVRISGAHIFFQLANLQFSIFN